MRYWAMICTITTAVWLMVSFAVGQEIETAREGELQQVVNDDFSTDTRGEYEIVGDVAWEAGKLTLNQGASIERSINGGPWAKLELDFGDDRWGAGEKDGELRIWFLLDGATDCYVRLRTIPKATNGHSGSVALIDTDEQDGKTDGQVIRELPLSKGTFRRLTIEYRYGLVTVTDNDSVLLTAHIDKGDRAVSGITVRTGQESLRLAEVFANCNRATTPLTAESMRLVKETTRVNETLFALYRQGNIAEAVERGEDVVKIRKKILGEEHPYYTTSLNNLAFLYEKNGDYNRAESLYLQARNISEKVLGKRHPKYATSVNNLASLYFSMGQSARAEPLFKQASEVWKNVYGEQNANYATSLNNLAHLYVSMREYARAEPLYLQSLDIRKKILGEEHPDYLKGLNNLAHLYMSMRQYTRAESLYLQSLDIRIKVRGEEHPDDATSLNNLAVLYEKMGDHRRAESLLLQACDIRKKVLGEDDPMYASSLINLASVYQSMGDLAQAERLYLAALDIRKKVLGVEHADYAASLNSLASLYKSMSDYGRAERLCLQACAIRKKVLGEEDPDYAASLHKLAHLYQLMGEYARAEPLYLKALNIRKNILGKDDPAYAVSLGNLAGVYQSMGDFLKAERLHLEAIDINKRVLGKESASYAMNLSNLADLYQSMGRFVQAAELSHQAIEILKNALGEEHPDYATSLNNLAALLGSMGEYVRAEEIYLQAVRIHQNSHPQENTSYAISLSNLAVLYQSMDEHVKAEQFQRDAHRFFAAATFRALPSLASAQVRGWMDKNRPRTDLLLAVLRCQRKYDSHVAYEAVWATKGMVDRLRVGQSLGSDATPAAREAFAELRDAKIKLARLVTATPSPKQADAFRQALSAASERKESLEKKLAELNTATARELSIRDGKIEDLFQQLPDGVAVVDFVQLDDWNHVDSEITLHDGEGNTETRIVKKPKSHPVYDAFVLRADRSAENPAKWIPLGAAEPIEIAISAWRTKLTQESMAGSGEVLDDPGQRLRELIWDKLEPELDGIHTVVIIPDGALNRLPWAALPGRNAGEYLIHDYALTTASSGQQLYGLLVDPPIEAEPELLVVGGIEYNQRPQHSVTDSNFSLAGAGRPVIRSSDGDGWSELPGTEKEAAAISQLWGDRGAVTELRSTQADEHSLAGLLPKSRFAHLATHGFFDTRGEVYGTDLREQSLFESSLSRSRRQSSIAYRNPLLMTGIVVAGANVPPETNGLGLPVGDDGILTAEEISGLDLRNTELVTLSACETGLGDVAAGEGVYGLTKALHKSGVRSVVASQWKVSDTATQELMRHFYENLWVKKQSKIESLRNAQLWILKHPQELMAMGVQDATTRGKPGKLKTQATRPPSKMVGRTRPYFWAAFQLSGDWR